MIENHTVVAARDAVFSNPGIWNVHVEYVTSSLVEEEIGTYGIHSLPKSEK